MEKELFPFVAALATVTVLEAITGFSKGNGILLRSFLQNAFLILMLGQSYVAAKYARKERDQKFNYGYSRLNIMAAFANTVFLMSRSLFGFIDAF